MPSSTRPAAVVSSRKWRSRTSLPWSPSRIAASAFRPGAKDGSFSGSTGRTRVRPTTTAAWAWASTLAARSSRVTADRYGSPVRRNRARPSHLACHGPLRRACLMDGHKTPAGPILVVDDDPDLLEMVELVLESADYTVVPAMNGVEALKRVQGSHPALILLDM